MPKGFDVLLNPGSECGFFQMKSTLVLGDLLMYGCVLSYSLLYLQVSCSGPTTVPSLSPVAKKEETKKHSKVLRKNR